ncbi:MAG: hypothetical protein JWQ38_2078 [Flavipsychrobacter sp.]|nr:hypothetical protein [Flavipsychrobacter sp.]
MDFFKKPILFLASAMLAAPLSGFAQYKFEVEPLFSYFKEAKRYELGFNYVVPMAEFAGVTAVYSGSTKIGDTTTKRNITATQGIGGDIGLSLPIKATGHTSCFAASFHIMGNMLTWTGVNPTQNADGSVNTVTSSKSVDISTIQISVPIGIEWKAGNDAILTKRLPFGTTLGIGAMPQVTMTTLTASGASATIDPKMSFGCTPYAKVELSIFAGLDFKLRAMYSLGNITLIDVNKGIGAGSSALTDGPFKITSTSNLMLSLIIMPFSGGWHETAWYNTYDTYNQHDRLN